MIETQLLHIYYNGRKGREFEIMRGVHCANRITPLRPCGNRYAPEELVGIFPHPCVVVGSRVFKPAIEVAT